MRWLLLVVLSSLVVVPGASAWTWPVHGPVLETFAFDHAHPYAAGQHRGIAVGAEDGADVLAPAGGTVSFAGTVPDNGRTLTIETSDGLAVTLTHLGGFRVARGAAVHEGDVVGTVGAASDGGFGVPFVHLGIRTASDEQ